MNHPVLDAFQASSLDAIADLKHGFFGRRGGVSVGPYESLNCALYGDEKLENVIENRVRACSNLGIWPGALVTVRQVHGSTTAIINAPYNDKNVQKARVADAMVTAKSGIALGLLTADCAPVLLVDPKAGVIGAAHAGWRGALGGVLRSVVNSMETLGANPKNITAVIGPTIGPGSYEVGPEFPKLFQAEDPANKKFFSDSSGQLRFDLPGYIAARLSENGVRTLDLGHDTFREVKNFFSYRQTTKSGKSETGRQLSVICL